MGQALLVDVLHPGRNLQQRLVHGDHVCRDAGGSRTVISPMGLMSEGHCC